MDVDGQVNALFLYPDASVPGGVVAYVETIRKYFPSTIKSRHLPVGSGRGEESPLIAKLRPIIDSYKVFKILRKGDIDVVMLNPSFNFKSIVRDGLFLLICRLTGSGPASVQFHGWSFDFSTKVKRSRNMRGLFSSCYNYATDIGVLSSAIYTEMALLGVNLEELTLKRYDCPTLFSMVLRCYPKRRKYLKHTTFYLWQGLLIPKVL